MNLWGERYCTNITPMQNGKWINWRSTEFGKASNAHMFPQCLMESSSEGKDERESNNKKQSIGKHGTETTVYTDLESGKLDTALGSKLLPQQRTWDVGINTKDMQRPTSGVVTRYATLPDRLYRWLDQKMEHWHKKRDGSDIDFSEDVLCKNGTTEG